MRGFQNPNMQRIGELLRSFDRDWGDQIEVSATDEMKQAVNSIVDNRNRIAHGENVGISFAPLRRYYQNAVDVIELIEHICNP